MKRKWLIATKISEDFKNRFLEVNPIVLQLLYNRNLTTQDAIDEFLNPDYGQDIHDPFLFKDMERAVKRIFKAITEKEKITVHGDYDADGVCSTVVIVTALETLGADVDVYIPHRVSEGYGLNNNTVESLFENGTNLIITVDCGISSKDEVALANKKGIDVIITDHHEQPPELPPAYAIINPHVKGEKYPFKNLAGCGVAFKLVQAMILKDRGGRIKNGFEKWLLDIVAVGTIGDLVPLIGENRTLVKYGTVVLRKTKRLGLRELIESSRFTIESIDTTNISFGIVPRLNAAGRIDHANKAYQLLMAKDVDTVKEVANNLDKTNRERQKITEKLIGLAKDQIGEVSDKKILFAIGKDWSVGVVGLVAGRLSDQYARPAIVMGEDDDKIVGSGRSIPGFDITDALIQSRDLLERFGGHAGACGFTLLKRNLDKFKEKINKIAQAGITDKDMIKIFSIDSEVKMKDMNWELLTALEDFGPFGEGNKLPKFVANGLCLNDFKKIGRDGKHLRLTVEQDGVVRKMIAFGFGDSIGNELKIGDIIDTVFELSVNEWNGNRELQLKLVDIKKK